MNFSDYLTESASASFSEPTICPTANHASRKPDNHHEINMRVSICDLEICDLEIVDDIFWLFKIFCRFWSGKMLRVVIVMAFSSWPDFIYLCLSIPDEPSRPVCYENKLPTMWKMKNWMGQLKLCLLPNCYWSRRWWILGILHIFNIGVYLPARNKFLILTRQQQIFLLISYSCWNIIFLYNAKSLVRFQLVLSS